MQNKWTPIFFLILFSGINNSPFNIGTATAFKRQTLFDAIEANHIDLVKELLVLGFDIDNQNMEEDTPLIVAAKKVNEPIVKLLLEKKAKVKIRSREGKTPIFGALYKNNINIVKLLLEKRADVKISDMSGRTTLMDAIMSGMENHTKIAKLLLENGVDINAQTPSGESALHMASEFRSSIHTIKLILENGSQVNMVNEEGLTPLDNSFKSLAKKYTSQESMNAVKLLLKAGGKVSRNWCGVYPEKSTDLYR